VENGQRWEHPTPEFEEGLMFEGGESNERTMQFGKADRGRQQRAATEGQQRPIPA